MAFAIDLQRRIVQHRGEPISRALCHRLVTPSVTPGLASGTVREFRSIYWPAAGDQRSLLSQPAAVRAARLREAVRQARSVAGPDAALRILEVDPESRVPERRLALTPWEP